MIDCKIRNLGTKYNKSNLFGSGIKVIEIGPRVY